MNNLFDYATKELSQDAFLRWLFESWKDKDLKDIVMDLFNNFGIDIDYDDIVNVTTHKVSNIDISVIIETKTKPILLLIEDKTESNAHDNQLLVYDGKIFGALKDDGTHTFIALENLNSKMGKKIFNIPNNKEDKVALDFKVYRVFFKTALLTDLDYLYINETKVLPETYSAAGSAGKEGWKTFDVNDIYDILEKYKYSNNILINMYIDRLTTIQKEFNNTAMPTTDDPRDWYIYFTNVLVPYFRKKGYIVDAWNFRGKDAGFGLKLGYADSDYNDFDSRKNERLYLQYSNKNINKGTIKLLLSTDQKDKEYYDKHQDEVLKLKLEIKRMNDAFGLSKYPLATKDSYLKPESNIVAATQALPTNSTEDLIKSLEIAIEQLKYIEHDLKMI